MDACYDDDAYAEPQPAELSGPVGTTRTRPRRTVQPCPSYGFVSYLGMVAHALPDHTGPPN